MNARAAAAIALWPVLLVATPARPQGNRGDRGDRWERQVRRQLEHATASLGARRAGKSLASRVGMLDTDESESVMLTLQAGMSYLLVGACDEDCSGLGLVLSDMASRELTADRARDNAPVVRVTPRETALYRVKVIMESCRMNPCRYGVALIALPTP
jgi:hypothetical protein